jgi:hypothetical protein
MACAGRLIAAVATDMREACEFILGGNSLATLALPFTSIWSFVRKFIGEYKIS